LRQVPAIDTFAESPECPALFGSDKHPAKKLRGDDSLHVFLSVCGQAVASPISAKDIPLAEGFKDVSPIFQLVLESHLTESAEIIVRERWLANVLGGHAKLDFSFATFSSHLRTSFLAGWFISGRNDTTEKPQMRLKMEPCS
jgi:hypothetical protein